MSVQQEKKTAPSYQQRNQHSQQHQASDKQSRVGLRSCLRGGIEIEEAESKKKLFYFTFKII
jgi:hypothetical protein